MVNQTFEMSFGYVTAAFSGGGGTQLHTTTIKSYDPITLTCLVCTGDREGHHILDNYDGQGITIHIRKHQLCSGNKVLQHNID